MLLITVAVLGILLLLFLVIRLRMAAFVALLLTSVLVGLGTNMPATDIVNSIRDGMGGTLGFVAVVVGLGAILGKLLEASGGVQCIADTIIGRLGADRAQWGLGITGFIVAIPVFFDVALIILIPVVYGLAQSTGRSLLYYAIPLLAGLAVTHSFVPPTPGPIAVADLLDADLGWVIIFGALAGIPSMILAGPLFGRYLARRIHVKVPESFAEVVDTSPSNTIGFGQVSTVILLPLLLIMLSTVTPIGLGDDHAVTKTFAFLGHPFVALLAATLLAMVLLARLDGFSKDDLLAIANKGLEPAGVVILITGAGGAFKQLLIDSGVGDALAETMADSRLPLVLLAFLIAALTRIAQGSATVAMITAAGLLSPITASQELSAAMLAVLVIAISSGATILSHVNDSGFWLVSRYLEMSEKDTLRSWTVMTTIIALTGLTVTLVLSAIL
ncbi:MAG: gluconate:H+ symporter [Pseudomonadota bacterium]